MSAAESATPRLYWPAQRQRNRGVNGLLIVVAAFLALYAYLFPGLISVGGVAKFSQSWLPLALVSMAQAILMLAGGVSLAIGAMVSLGAVIAATTMAGPLGVAGGAALVIVAGLGVGAACGVIVVRLGLPAIVVTLAASFIVGGGALLILPRPGGAIPAWLSDLLAGDKPVAALLVIVAVVFGKSISPRPLALVSTRPAKIRSRHTAPACPSTRRGSPLTPSAGCSRLARASSSPHKQVRAIR
jgi:ribose transport system permease protein